MRIDRNGRHECHDGYETLGHCQPLGTPISGRGKRIRVIPITWQGNVRL
jgi:hypothetical protein